MCIFVPPVFTQVAFEDPRNPRCTPCGGSGRGPRRPHHDPAPVPPSTLPKDVIGGLVGKTSLHSSHLHSLLDTKLNNAKTAKISCHKCTTTGSSKSMTLQTCQMYRGSLSFFLRILVFISIFLSASLADTSTRRRSRFEGDDEKAATFLLPETGGGWHHHLVVPRTQSPTAPPASSSSIAASRRAPAKAQ